MEFLKRKQILNTCNESYKLMYIDALIIISYNINNVDCIWMAWGQP